MSKKEIPFDFLAISLMDLTEAFYKILYDHHMRSQHDGGNEKPDEEMIFLLADGQKNQFFHLFLQQTIMSEIQAFVDDQEFMPTTFYYRVEDVCKVFEQSKMSQESESVRRIFDDALGALLDKLTVSDSRNLRVIKV